MNIKYLILLIVILLSGRIKAQSDFDLSQRWFNESIYNPGATGNYVPDEKDESNPSLTNIFLHSRAQWLGTDGAPLTNVISVDTYAANINSGIGLTVYNDKIGYLNSWSAKLSYAYYIHFEWIESSLALGLSGYLQNRNANIEPEMLDNVIDPAISFSKINEYSPNFDFGIEFQGPVRIGASVRYLLRSTSSYAFFPSHSMNIWTYASSKIKVSDNLTLEPMVSYMYRDNIARIEGGLLGYFFSKKCWLGGTYRLNKQFSVIAGIKLFDKISLGYSFDHAAIHRDLAIISKMGTHEIFLSWKIAHRSIGQKDKACPAYN
jgi:type IX secretion system PorP/SprF family membrane protein